MLTPVHRLQRTQAQAVKSKPVLHFHVGRESQRAKIRHILRGGNVQAKLKVNAPNDKYEQETDRVAEQVMRMPEPQVQRQECSSPDCKEEDEIVQTKSVDNAGTVNHSLIQSVLSSPGQPLDATTRSFMEPRFRQDFSRVRVHTDRQAAESARAVNARAYTVGWNVVFGVGQYALQTSVGRRLLAHELTHVVQQKSESSNQVRSSIQRQSKKKKLRRDVALLLTDEPFAVTEAKTLTLNGVILRAQNVNQLAKMLKRIKFPIRNLVIISHSLRSGDIGFSSGSSTTFVMPSKLASKLMGSIASQYAPELVDFRGCSIGSSPAGMEKIRKALGAKAIIAGNCYMILLTRGPISIDKQRITKPKQVNESNRTTFQTGLQQVINGFGSAKKCVLETSEKAYFRAGGKLMALWSHPNGEVKWDPRKSICYKALQVVQADPSSKKDFSPGLAGKCKLIRVDKKP
jgi:hypothetical protein